jgi:valyl-tRNA synthetase
MSEIPKTYDPHAVEAKWYRFWLDRGSFVASSSSPKPAYSIVIPPPNVTGVLHMGHVLNNTIQDILARKARMDGREVLWLPGTDHAGIATEGMVEKQLRKEEKKSKRDIGREEFLKRVWVWKEKHGNIIIDQLKKLGCSCDWSRQRFTMDDEYVRCVQKAFVELYKSGLIYRGKRMVNWCPATLTALSDEEVEMEPQKGALYYFRVEVAEDPGIYLTIATTRPETIPGDTAIAVSPKDPRYSEFIGKHVIRPLPAELPRERKLIPIIADEQIDPEFGTGVLKVTPAHDKADFDIGQRHKLPAVDIMNPNGTMNQLAGADLNGLDRFEARKVAVEKLKGLEAWVKDEPYENKVGFSQRARVPIEPRLSEQWFLKYPSVDKSRACVANGEMKFYPDRWAKVYEHWMGNIQDWCISRQLWWGHRVPVWTLEKEYAAGDLANDQLNGELQSFLETLRQSQRPGISIRQGSLAGPEAENKGVTVQVCLGPGLEDIASKLESFGFSQDPDVLDTWCSSWLWPFATMNWTGDAAKDAQNETLKKFYPTTDLVTGPDIIFFWVARMIMAGYEFMGEMPFRNVYFTGIIRDKQGRKMSKTLGNSPDPLDLIGRYSADALRFGVMRTAPLGQDVLFDEQQVELGRNFCTKLWNACRFRQMQGGESEGEINPSLLTGDDKWILLRLDTAIREINTALDAYKFNEATQALYRFFWGEFCDWYLETTKAVFFGDDAQQKANTLAVIDFVLSNTLRLFHPFLPFITEELWHGLGYNLELPPGQGGESIMFAHWPKPLDDDFKSHYGLDESDERLVNTKYDLVTQGRNLKREANITKKAGFVFKPANEWTAYDNETVRLLLNADKLEVVSDYQPRKGTPTVRSVFGELYLPLEGLVDMAAEKVRLAKELVKIASEIEKVQQKLNNPTFVQKVPAAVLEEHRKRLADWQAKKQFTRTSLDALDAG